MTYTYCKTVIQKGTYTSVDDMKNMLDVFLLNERITAEQYNELITMLP